MKKIIFILIASLLVLAACDETNEPTPAKMDSDTDLYLVVNGWEDVDNGVIYSSSGDIIFISEIGHIKQLTTEGKDWYAVIIEGYSYNCRYHIIKNGQELFSTDETVVDLCVDNGNIYTLRHRMIDWQIEYQWVYKNQERIYQIDANEYFSNQMLVEDGHITLGPYYSPAPRYWQDGQFIAMQGIEGKLEDCFIDKVGNDVLIGFSGENGLYGYWRNGQYFENPINELSIKGVKLVNGKVILVGSVLGNQGVGGVEEASIIVIDGKEYRPEGIIGTMRRYGKDFYVLTHSKLNQVLKNMKPVPLGCIEVKSEYHQKIYGDSIYLSELPVSDFAIISIALN